MEVKEEKEEEEAKKDEVSSLLQGVISSRPSHDGLDIEWREGDGTRGVGDAGTTVPIL